MSEKQGGRPFVSISSELPSGGDPCTNLMTFSHREDHFLHQGIHLQAAGKIPNPNELPRRIAEVHMSMRGTVLTTVYYSSCKKSLIVALCREPHPGVQS